MAANAQRDLSMLNIGKQCTHPKCYLVDFLPFKCDHCEQTYCGDHFMPLVHNCEKYDESKHNRIAPPCPFCATPIAIPPGQDPNVRMDRHFNEDCSVLTGKSGKSSSAPHCARPKCGKVLFSPIPCDKCKQQFCPQHRFPDTHSCATSSTNLKASASSSSSPSSRPMQPAAVSAAAMAAIKRAMNNTASSSATAQKQPQTQTKATPPQTKLPPSTSVKSNASASPSRSNPFSAADRSVSPRTAPSSPTPTSPNATVNATTTTPDDTNTTLRRSPPPVIPASLLFMQPYVPRPIFASA